MEDKILKAKVTIENLRKDIRLINEKFIQERKKWIEKEKAYIEELKKSGASYDIIKYFHSEWSKEREKLEEKIQFLQKEVNNLHVNLLYHKWDNE